MASLSLPALRSIRASFRRAAELREALHAQFQHPPLPPRLPPAPSPVSSVPAPISYASTPGATTLVRLAAEDAFTDSLARFRTLSQRAAAMAPVGQSLLIFRSSLRHAYAARVARMMRRAPRGGPPRPVTRFASPPAVCNAAVGMGLAAIVARDHRESAGPVSLLRLLSSTEGPQRVGIGVLPRPARLLLANSLACCVAGAAVWLVVLFPHAVPWLLVCAGLCFAARPDVESFRAWTRKCAPIVASRKTMWVDRLRAKMAPYVMQWRPVKLDDYGLFSVVTVVDHADYVYVYAGVLSRWLLLGWYNIADDYNFDRIRS